MGHCGEGAAGDPNPMGLRGREKYGVLAILATSRVASDLEPCAGPSLRTLPAYLAYCYASSSYFVLPGMGSWYSLGLAVMEDGREIHEGLPWAAVASASH